MTSFSKPPVGARPGTLAIDSSARDPRIRVFTYDEQSIEERELSGEEQVRTLDPGGRKLWIDVQGLGDEGTLRQLAERFSIHSLALEDVVNVPIRPKAEVYEKNLLIVTRMLRTQDDGELAIEQVSIIVGRGYVVTFQHDYGDVLDPVRQRLRSRGAMMRRLESDYLAYAILDTIVDAYYPVIEALGDRIELLEDEVLTTAAPGTIRELNSIKGLLLKLRRAVTPQREAVATLLRGDTEFVSDDVRIFLRDTYDHIVQTADAVEMARELVNGLMNTYMSVISHRLNEVMKTLTIVASIFVPLTFFAGIYGMNFEHMPELQFRWAYPLLLLLMGLTAAGMTIYFWRKGWIRPGR